MKRYIYTTLLVFATLFCQASEVPKDTVCVKPGDTVRLIEYKNSIQEFLENKEKAIWSGCCEKVEVEWNLKDVSGSITVDNDPKPLKGLSNIIIHKDAMVRIEVQYTRRLVSTKIPLQKESGMSDDSLAMWYFFGRLLSETEPEAVTKVSDTAYVTTLHEATFVYYFQLALPDTSAIPFKIKGDICFVDEKDKVELSVDSAYLKSDYNLIWIAPGALHSNDKGIFWKPKILNDYLYPVVCTATACKGETRSDTVFIGKPTPQPEIEDINCIPSSENSFVAKVRDADSRLSYHWIFEESGSNREQQYSEGDSVTFAISPNMPGVLRLISTGGCRASDTVPRELHRSVMAGDIRLGGDTNCLFGGDSLSLVLQNAPQEHLVWHSKAGADTLLWNADFVYRTNRTDTGILAVSVFSKNCPEDTAVATFNIRKDLAVSIDPNESCISAYTAQTFRAIGNGINPEIFWNGNGVDIDTVIYGKKDSVQLRLTNPGGNNLYVAVRAKECGRESVWDTLVLRPKPEIPKMDTLWKALTPCIPLGKADTIELRVQPQEGIKFDWPFSGSSKFQKIGKLDSNSIRVRVNYESLDRDTIPVSVYAYTDGCSNSDTLETSIVAKGADLDVSWKIGSLKQGRFRYMGYYKENQQEIMQTHTELDSFYFDWKCSVAFSRPSDSLTRTPYVKGGTPLPFDVSCLLTNKNTSCYSYYIQTIEETATLQNILPPSNDRDNSGRISVASEMSYMNVHSKDNSFDGIVLAPNPTQANTLLYLGNTDIGEHTVIEIFTEQGVCLYRQKVKGSMVELPTARFGSGLYFVRVRTDEGSPVVKKLIVQ